MIWLRQLSIGKAILWSVVWPLLWLAIVALRIAGVMLSQYRQHRRTHDAAFSWSIGWSRDPHWVRELLLFLGPSFLFFLVWLVVHPYRGPAT